MAEGDKYHVIESPAGWSIRRLGESTEIVFMSKADGYDQKIIDVILYILNKRGE